MCRKNRREGPERQSLCDTKCQTQSIRPVAKAKPSRSAELFCNLNSCGDAMKPGAEGPSPPSLLPHAASRQALSPEALEGASSPKIAKEHCLHIPASRPSSGSGPGIQREPPIAATGMDLKSKYEI